HGLVLVGLVDPLAGHEGVERDVDRALDAPRLPLVRLTHVEDLHVVLALVHAAGALEIAHASRLASARWNAECVDPSNSTNRTSRTFVSASRTARIATGAASSTG